MTRTRTRGFSLIELMIVVVIVAVLATVAYPSYVRHIEKTRRVMAQGCLLELGQWMERHYTQNLATGYANATLPSTQCRNDLNGLYTFGFADSQPTTSTYTLNATASGAQLGDSNCRTLILTHTGAKSATNASGADSTATCW